MSTTGDSLRRGYMHTFCSWIRQGMQGAAVLALLLLPLCAQTGLAQAQPRAGGELVMAVPSEPPSYDGHREETFGLIHPVAPFYSLLLRVDLDDPNKIVGDLAQRWTIAEDGLSYTFTMRQGGKFHD